ncbi:DNA/RNA non-specific endonuclease [Aquimarina algiphila]|uniref:DNA/RNA non-specific endonuclease n=1 Tax=Aquimarina algiphila TaxID=2047982 RepID=UPI0023300F70|nr:DNA/RNA non-specific endonuclease [Aquimarina algiphila]
MDNTKIHPKSENFAHLIDIHLWRGAPQNLDENREIQILVNQGHVVGFCPDRLQPAWSAYRVAYATDDVKYDRPINYYNDLRLDKQFRIGKNTFGKIGGIQLNVGHMTPNEVINRQFGRLAQMETFFMSNMSPQYGSLNSGVWLKLETAIREIEDKPREHDHVWVIVGPIFGDTPEMIYRGQDKHLPVPEAYFCVTVDPYRYPYDTLSKAYIDCFIIPQNAPGSSYPEDYPATLEEVEEATNLKFFDSWSRDIPLGLVSQKESQSESRLIKILRQKQLEVKPSESILQKTRREAQTVDQLIEGLKSEAIRINVLNRDLTEDESIQLKTIQHTISWLIKAKEISNDSQELNNLGELSNLITYKIISDMDGKLKQGARTSCNFWSQFIEPKQSIVIRLGIFTSLGGTIARAYKPYENEGVRYGRVEFNTKFLGRFTEDEIAGTIIHEIGHTLGIGWEDWSELFNSNTGKFTSDAISKLNELEIMEVERDGGGGTAFAHWDEDKFDKELMTGYKNTGEYVLPVTINLMSLLGHKVIEPLEQKTALSELLKRASNLVFSQQDAVRRIDLDYFEETELLETIPHE